MKIRNPFGKSFDPFAQYLELVSWSSIGGYTMGGDDGYSCTPLGVFITLKTSAVINTDARIYSTERFPSLVLDGKVLTIEIPITYLPYADNQNIWLRFGGELDDPPNEIRHHFGWKIIANELWASNGNGLAQTITDTGFAIPDETEQAIRLKMIHTPNSKIEYYVNDVLKATHTTNLPTEIEYYLHFDVKTLVADSRYISIGRVLIQRQY